MEPARKEAHQMMASFLPVSWRLAKKAAFWQRLLKIREIRGLIF